MRDEAVLRAFYKSPAALLHRYQQLMKLAGKDPEAAFPQGTWQFYVDYALREDTARHAFETLGFQTALARQKLRLDPIDRLSTWVLTAVECLHEYPRLLENEWRERVYTHLLRQISYNPKHSQIYRRWERQRPYSVRLTQGGTEDYPAFRKRRFDQFLATVLSTLPDPTRRDWETAVINAEAAELSAYQDQLNILAYLRPDQFGETRMPFSIEDAKIGLIIQGHYYLVPVCQFGTSSPIQIEEVRHAIAAILEFPPTFDQTPIKQLVQLKRLALNALQPNLPKLFQDAWAQMRFAPIWLNFDTENWGQPLAYLRQGERGLGDHALTIFDNGKSTVFDLSHIFFDGIWGASLAEILTNKAILWANRLEKQPYQRRRVKRPSPLRLHLDKNVLERIQNSPKVAVESAAESDQINLRQLQQLRSLFKKHIDFLNLTVNDILILYRAIHAVSFKPNPAIIFKLRALEKEPQTQKAATLALNALFPTSTIKPAILIPVDASRTSPRDRVYPVTFDIPLNEFDLVNLHQRTLAALNVIERSDRNRQAALERFKELQEQYLNTLSIVGQILSRYKARAVQGQSLSIDSIKLLAHLPTPIQRFLDKIPNQFDAINDIVKGREVFSNVGAVVSSSSLHRFITAKDDNEKKELVWGVLTDAQGKMRITFRDFRPHVAALTAVGAHETAAEISQDQLDAYVEGFNQFVVDLIRILTVFLDPSDEPKFDQPPTSRRGILDYIKQRPLLFTFSLISLILAAFLLFTLALSS